MRYFWAVLLGVIVILSSLHASYSQTYDSSLVGSSVIVTKIGASLTKSSIESGDLESALVYSKFTTDYYSQQIGALRPTENPAVDQLHLLLIDIHSKIENGSLDSVSADLDYVLSEIEKFPKSNDKNLVIVNILGVADQTYQKAFTDNSSQYYTISYDLITEAELISESIASNERQEKEIEEFFFDLKSLINSKADFIPTSKLITAIQRDLTKTDSLTSEKSNLFNSIKDKYSKANQELKNGNYQRAEELVISAYLDNFEYLEGDIEKVDESLVHNMESNMREKLRDMVREKKSPESISAFIEDPILKDLNQAESLFSNLKDNNIQFADAETITPKPLNPIGSASEEQKSGVRSQIDIIRDKLETMLEQYKEGNYEAALTTARIAYLDSYEHVEIPLRNIDPDFTLEVELQFAQMRQLINERADFDLVQEEAVKVRRSLDESERLVTGTGQLAPSIAFTSSFAVIFREGLESVLILGAILTYLEASRNTKYKKFVYYGIVIAIGATAITWIAASYIIEISGANRELVEAIAALSATAVLFYVSFWILNKIEHKKWMEFVKAKVWKASTTGGVAVFVLLSFFTIYREGFETVLFYQAMFGFAKHMESYVGLGFVLGIGVLLAVYYITRQLGKRLPLKILFGLTMGVGAYLSIAFLGNAIRELQTLDLLPFTSMLGIIPRLDINLAKMTGIYPTLESLIGQVMLLSVYLAASTYVLVLRPKRDEQISSMRKSRKEIDEFEAH